MFYSLPPTGAPLRGRDILAGFKSFCRGDDEVSQFESQIRRYFGVEHAVLLSSGKAALSIALGALSRASVRREVIIPAFSSFCLPSAIAKAGLRIRLCDVRPDTLDFDLDQLSRMVTEQTLCVIPVHLFGLSSQVDQIQQIAREQGAFVIEDAAQGAGGELNGRKFGTIGDIGVISLGRGKNITTVEGGILLTSSDSLAERIRDSVVAEGADECSTSEQIHSAIKALALSLFLRPRVYWLPERLPFLKLGASEFSTDFAVQRFSRFHAGIGRSIFSQLDEYNLIRATHAAYLMNQLDAMEGVSLPVPLPHSRPAYLRFPLLMRDRSLRERCYTTLKSKGLGASTTYPTTLSVIRELRSYAVDLASFYPGAEAVADRILTLPTHSYVTPVALRQMADALGVVGVE